MDTSTRRVRHEVADGVALMGFSLGVSIALAIVIAIGVGLA
jgi:small basic protein